MTETTTEPIRQDFDIANVPMQDDRSTGYQYMLDFGDVFRSPDGIWWITHPEGVNFVFRHPSEFSSQGAFDVIRNPYPNIPGGIDPPDHRRFRSVMDVDLRPRAVNAMEDQLRELIGSLVDELASKGRCEIMNDLARPFPSQVFLTLFGLPLDDLTLLLGWVETILSQGPWEETRPEVTKASEDLVAYLQGHMELKRKNPAEDMLSRIIQVSGDDAWTDEEILGMCYFFVNAGLDTVKCTIGTAFYHLAQRPDLRETLLKDPSRVPDFIEELVRLEPAAPLQPRITTQDVEVCGVPIPQGSYVLLSTGAANRHPDAYATPHDFDLEQADGRHKGFGGGIHRCAGVHLARRELRLVIEEFHKRIPDYELTPGSRPRIEPWPRSLMMLDSVPLEFRAA